MWHGGCQNTPRKPCSEQHLARLPGLLPLIDVKRQLNQDLSASADGGTKDLVCSCRGGLMGRTKTRSGMTRPCSSLDILSRQRYNGCEKKNRKSLVASTNPSRPKPGVAADTWQSQRIHGLVCAPGRGARCVEIDERLDHQCCGGIKEGAQASIHSKWSSERRVVSLDECRTGSRCASSIQRG